MTNKNNSECFISLDVGTTSVKVALFNSHGDMLATSAKEYSLYTPSENIVELNAEKYWECCKEGIREILAESNISPEQIKSIGVCSQGETLIVLDNKGQPLRNAIVWLDNRSQEETEEIKKVFGSESNTGQIDVFPTWPITKILWLKKNEPDIFKRIYNYMLVEDYILYRFAGKFIGEYSLYTSSYMLDIINKKWWREILDYVGINDGQLVELCESGEIIGNIKTSVSKELGLSPNTLIVSGSMDQTSAMVGSGNLNEGIITEATGAALAVCGTLNAFPKNKKSSMAVQYHSIPDKYFVIGWCPTGGMALKWLRDTFFVAERDEALSQKKDTYKPLTDMAEKVSIGSQGLLFFPYMAGPGTLNITPEARGVFYGIELHHTRAHFIRAVMESIAFILRKNLKEIESISVPCIEIRSLGGGSKSSYWNHIKADVTDKTITTMKCPEAASLGTAVLQAVALGYYPNIEAAVQNMVKISSVIHPEEENQHKYESIFQNYIRVEKRCFCKE